MTLTLRGSDPKFGFGPASPVDVWEKRNVPPSGAPDSGAPRLDQVGEFEVATDGGIWVATGGRARVDPK